MIHWLWAPIAASAGLIAGVLLMSLLYLAGENEECCDPKADGCCATWEEQHWRIR